jgi:hypothetical protein
MEKTDHELENLLHYLNLPGALWAAVRSLRFRARTVPESAGCTRSHDWEFGVRFLEASLGKPGYRPGAEGRDDDIRR